MADYVKLSNLVNDKFTVQKIWGSKYKMWDEQERKMLVSDTWIRDYRKIWEVDTDKGKLDMSQAQVASLLEAVCINGAADIVGRTFSVKSNGKDGMEIRYFFDAVPGVPTSAQAAPAPAPKPAPVEVPDNIDMDSIPF